MSVVMVSRKQLALRCEQNAVSESDVMKYVVRENAQCFFLDTDISDFPQWLVARGLGGTIKAGLSAIGITEERVSKAIGRPCGCSERAERLDEFGRKFGIG